MPKSVKYYQNPDKLREYRNKQRALNYKRGWIDSHDRVWTVEENLLVLDSTMSDRELSKKIERSVAAIQVQRSRLKKLKNNYNFNNF